MKNTMKEKIMSTILLTASEAAQKIQANLEKHNQSVLQAAQQMITQLCESLENEINITTYIAGQSNRFQTDLKSLLVEDLQYICELRGNQLFLVAPFQE